MVDGRKVVILICAGEEVAEFTERRRETERERAQNASSTK
jgi:hypothetical protein